MRTKAVEGVLRCDLIQTEPRPEVYLLYDGLGGVSKRPMLRDLIEEFQRHGPEALYKFLDAVRRSRSGGDVHVYFSDYVSYGIGGGDATSEFFLGRFLLRRVPPRAATPTSEAAPEELQLYRPHGVERLIIDGP